jgi:large subunit ribosomal protein L19e
MKLDKKKKLAAKVLNVGKGRIWFNPASLQDIKEAITRQDIKDLVKEKVIKIKPVTGKHKKEKRKTRRGAGKIKKKVRNKKEYIYKIRKMRACLSSLRKSGRISSKEYLKLRRYAKAGMFIDLKHLKENVGKV